MNLLRWVKIIAGPLAFLVLLVYSYYAPNPMVVRTLGVAAWLVIWWVTEAVPIGVTSLLPIILLPAIGNDNIQQVASSYGDPVIFLFLGGFIIAIAMEKWNLHKRLALTILKITGTNANGIVLGFLIATAFISMWISNTATTVMMLPIGISVIKLVDDTLEMDKTNPKGFRNFASSIMIGIAYAASIGGLGTIIGTPPNMVMTGFMKKLANFDMPFLDWMVAAVPLVVVMIAATYFVMTRLVLRNNLGRLEKTAGLISDELTLLGKISRDQLVVILVFSFTVTLWVLRVQINKLVGAELLHDATIALIGGLLFFAVPSATKPGNILNWEDLDKLPWKILLLFGGGIALAGGVENVGIIKTVGDTLAGIDGIDAYVMVTLLAAAGVFMSEIMGNIALATVYIPVAMAIGSSLGQSPVLFAIPVAMATSFGFMLPIATPPNAIAYGSGYINSKDMLKVGFILNIAGIVLIYFAARFYFGLIF